MLSNGEIITKRIIIVRSADLGAIFFRRFSLEKCVFLFHVQWKLSLFFGRNVTSQIEMLIFLGERDTFRNKIMEIVEDFDGKSYNNNYLFKNVFIFSFFIFSFFHLLSFSFIFLHFLSFSFIFFHFLSFVLSFFFLFFIFFIFIHFLCLFLSFSFIFLTFSDIFYHVLSFS